MSERRIVFVAQDGAAVPPLAEAARAVGLEPVVVAARGLDAVERAGLRLVRLDSAPSLNPVTAGYGAGRLAAFLRHEGASLVHCLGLRAVLVGGAAAAMVGIPRRVFSLSRADLLADRSGPAARVGRLGVRALVRGLSTAQTRYLLEDGADPALLGSDAARVGADDAAGAQAAYAALLAS